VAQQVLHDLNQEVVLLAGPDGYTDAILECRRGKESDHKSPERQLLLEKQIVLRRQPREDKVRVRAKRFESHAAHLVEEQFSVLDDHRRLFLVVGLRRLVERREQHFLGSPVESEVHALVGGKVCQALSKERETNAKPGKGIVL